MIIIIELGLCRRVSSTEDERPSLHIILLYPTVENCLICFVCFLYSLSLPEGNIVQWLRILNFIGYPGFKSPSCNLPCVFSIVPISYSLHTSLWPAGLLSDSGLSLLRFFKYLPLYTSLLLLLGHFVCESSHFQTRLFAFNEFRLHANIK